MPSTRFVTRFRALAAVVVISLVAAACGGGGSDSKSKSGSSNTPVSGGEFVVGLEAETLGGWCLPEATLAGSGLNVANAIYDTLTAYDDEAQWVPFLAESVTPNDTFDEWTIELREGVTFHNGEPLDAQIVADNITAWTGRYPGRAARLAMFAFSDIADVVAAGPTTVVVTTKIPWPTLPDFLGTGRYGIMAREQLDGDTDECQGNLIGTGPFQLVKWEVNNFLETEKNPDYWQEGLPRLDTLRFQPVPDATQRLNAVESGALDAAFTPDADTMLDFYDLEEAGKLRTWTESPGRTEVIYGMFNSDRAPFNDIKARTAAVAALDLPELNDFRNNGIFKLATGPFGPDVVGYLKEPGLVEYDPKRAQRLVDEMGGLSFTLNTPNTLAAIRTAQIYQSEWQEIDGIDVEINQVDQATLINEAIGGEFDVTLWRMHPGADPDTNQVWWLSDSPVNFGGFVDEEMDALLIEGRSSSDPDRRREIYERVNEIFAENAYNFWVSYATWTIAARPEVRGLGSVPLPGGGKGPIMFNGQQAFAAAWIDE